MTCAEILSPLSTYYLLFSGTPSWFSKLYPSYQYSPFSAPSGLYFSYGSSHLFISVTITTTNVLTDLLALQWEVKPQRERVSASVRERDRATHPPKNLAPITVHYVPRSCEMLDFQYSLAILSWLIHSSCFADTAIVNKLASTVLSDNHHQNLRFSGYVPTSSLSVKKTV